MYTYEALGLATQFTFPYCTFNSMDLFCKALDQCDSDGFYMKELICQQARQEYCAAEWRILEVNNQTENLVDCDEFGETVALNCTEQFDLANGDSVCLPLCKEFSQHGEIFTDAVTALNAFINLVNVFGGITVLIACFWKRKKM